MRNMHLLAVVTMLICVAFAAPAAGATLIDYQFTDENLWYVRQDPCVLTLNLEWTLPSGDKREFHEEGLDLVSFFMTADRATCWRLEAGNADQFDWTIIEEGLALSYGARVGERSTCVYNGQVLVPACFTVMVDVYVAYARDFYRVQQDCNVAVISVLRPVDDVAIVYRNVGRLGYPTCLGADLPQSNSGTCASMTNPPYAGNTCSSGTKYEFEDPGVNEPIETGTWGKIKSLYGN